jgi:hypothetical protein
MYYESAARAEITEFFPNSESCYLWLMLFFAPAAVSLATPFMQAAELEVTAYDF